MMDQREHIHNIYLNNMELREKLGSIDMRVQLMQKCLDIWGSKGSNAVVMGYLQCMDAISKDWPQPLPSETIIEAEKIILEEYGK